MGFFFVRFAVMRYGITQLAITPMRAEAADASEMINQVLFGEHFKVLEVRKKWSKIRLSHDKYEGWICNKQWQEIDKTTYTELDQQTPTLTTDLLDVVKNEQVIITKLAQGLPVGGEIEQLDDGTLFSAFKYRSKLNSNSD